VKVRWLKGALAAVYAIHSRISVENPQAAKRVVQEIRSATARLREFPLSGRQGEVSGTREVVVHNLPYVIVYRIRGDVVEILRVFHTATDWLNEPNSEL
jgi:addiction module RelE/StbE family toxin